MPLPSASLRHFLGGLTEEEALTNALTASLADDSSGEEDGGPATRDEAAMPQSGISFAKMTAMGFAATGWCRTSALSKSLCSKLHALHCSLMDCEEFAGEDKCQQMQMTWTVRVLGHTRA